MAVKDGDFWVFFNPVAGWFHLAVVYLGLNNGQGLVVYVNGEVERDTTKDDDTYQPGNGQLVIGKKFIDRNDDYSSVGVDELTLLNRQLTAQEIEDLYQMFP